MELTFDLQDFWQKTKKAILRPKVLYKEVEKETNWKTSFAYSIAISIVASIFGVIQASVLFPVIKNYLPSEFKDIATPTIIEILPAFLLSTVVIVALSFIYAWFAHQWLRLFKVKGNYWDSYRAYVYSRAPISVLGWVPWIGGIAGIYSLYVFVVGISSLHKISVKKSALLLVPLVVVFFVLQVMFLRF